MATVIDRPRRRVARDPFYPVMALVIATFAAAGFVPSYAASLAPPGLPWWVHLHGVVMTSWLLLFLAQSWLVRTCRLALHRTLGWASVALIVVMVPLAVATDMMAVRRGATPPIFTPAGMMATDWVDLATFVALYAAAVTLRRRADWHKRLLLSATVLLSFPGIGRIGVLHLLPLSGALSGAMVVLFALALTGPVHDLLRRGRVHPAYGWGVGAIVLAQPLHLLVAASPPMQALAARLISFS